MKSLVPHWLCSCDINLTCQNRDIEEVSKAFLLVSRCGNRKERISAMSQGLSNIPVQQTWASCISSVTTGCLTVATALTSSGPKSSSLNHILKCGIIAHHLLRIKYKIIPFRISFVLPKALALQKSLLRFRMNYLNRGWGRSPKTITFLKSNTIWKRNK